MKGSSLCDALRRLFVNAAASLAVRERVVPSAQGRMLEHRVTQLARWSSLMLSTSLYGVHSSTSAFSTCALQLVSPAFCKVEAVLFEDCGTAAVTVLTCAESAVGCDLSPDVVEILSAGGCVAAFVTASCAEESASGPSAAAGTAVTDMMLTGKPGRAVPAPGSGLGPAASVSQTAASGFQ